MKATDSVTTFETAATVTPAEALRSVVKSGSVRALTALSASPSDARITLLSTSMPLERRRRLAVLMLMICTFE